MVVLTPLIQYPTLATAIAGLWLSFRNIRRLQRYESPSEQAAKVSNEAARQLHRTRMTQGAAVISLLTSAYLSTTRLRSSTSSSSSPALDAMLAFALGAAAEYVGSFWNSKAKVPLVQDYNEAVQGTESVRRVLWTLAGMWLVGAVGGVLGL